jgi:hypothetical protein
MLFGSALITASTQLRTEGQSTRIWHCARNVATSDAALVASASTNATSSTPARDRTGLQVRIPGDGAQPRISIRILSGASVAQLRTGCHIFGSAGQLSSNQLVTEPYHQWSPGGLNFSDRTLR